MIKIERLDAKKNRDILEKIYKYEENIFGEAGVGKYNISPFTKYGRTYAIYNENDIISAIEVLLSNDTAYIYGVSTNLKYQNMGYAKKLVNFVLDDLINSNFKFIELTVTCNNKRAIKLYEDFNFKVKEILENEYFDNEKRYLMRKEV